VTWTFPPGGTEGVHTHPSDTEFIVVWGPPGTGLDWGAARMGLLSAAALEGPEPPRATP
jgi:hypothetical protein